MTASPMPHELNLFPPHSPPADYLLPRVRQALREGRHVLYVAPDSAAARERVLALAGEGALLDPPVTTLASHARAVAEHAGHRAPPPRLMELLLEDALRVEVPELPVAAGLAREAWRSIHRLMRDGWTPEAYGAALGRNGVQSTSARRLSRLWTRLIGKAEYATSAGPKREGCRDRRGRWCHVGVGWEGGA